MNARFVGLGAATVGLALTACGSSAAGGASPSGVGSTGPVTIGTTTAALGTFLVGPDGKSLYLFEADTAPASTCSGGCAQTWPPITTSGAPVAGTGVTASLLSTTRRPDGTLQVMYDGHPLYGYVGDTKAGDITGEGITSFGAGWDVVNPAGQKIEKP